MIIDEQFRDALHADESEPYYVMLNLKGAKCQICIKEIEVQNTESYTVDLSSMRRELVIRCRECIERYSTTQADK